ncbi:MAG: flagellar basal body P-ring formation chaperone FlgA [Acidobacteriia bacterium]|nr:flagellar basal body P-ring formation chaperone FlgA [Terriglobia bacterium]
MIPLASFALAGCLAVGAGADRIVAGDLAPAFPALAAVAADTPVALAPAPGVPRVFHAPELRLLAVRLGVAPAPESDVCVARKVAPLDPARLLDAMRSQLPQAHIEIVDVSRLPAPEGELEFPLSGLHQVPSGAYWNGFVRYTANRRFLIWAKVKVVVAAPRVIAVTDLKPGRAIDAAGLRLEMRDEFPTADVFATALEETAGKSLRRNVAAGTALRRQWLDAPKEIQRGDTVRVEVREGGAQLEFEAQADASGSTGQTIPVVNPVSKKRFQARVEGKGKVSVGKGTL